jgi:hypothetical protein
MNRRPGKLHLYSGKRNCPQEKKIFKLLKADEASHIGEIVVMRMLCLLSQKLRNALSA